MLLLMAPQKYIELGGAPMYREQIKGSGDERMHNVIWESGAKSCGEDWACALTLGFRAQTGAEILTM